MLSANLRIQRNVRLFIMKRRLKKLKAMMEFDRLKKKQIDKKIKEMIIQQEEVHFQKEKEQKKKKRTRKKAKRAYSLFIREKG